MKKRNSYLAVGLVMTGILTALIVFGFFWTPYDPNAMAAGPKLTGPSLAHLMGTDSFGRDIFSRVLKGAGTTYGIALCTVAVGAVCGTVLGAVTGYFGGIVDDVLMRLGDVLTAFPSILLALVLQRICNLTIGIFIAQFTLNIIFIGLIAVGLPDTFQNVVLGLFLLIVMILFENAGRIEEIREKRKVRQKALSAS